MRPLTALALPAFLAASGALAETPLGAAEFDALSVGKTLFYNAGGRAYGVEQYLPGRKVRWAFLGDECMEGYWYEEAEFICFVYDREPDPKCWTFYATPEGLMARFRDDPADLPLIAVEESDEPLACAGPDLGV